MGNLYKIFGQALEKLPHFIAFLGLLLLGFSFTTFDKGFHFPSATPNWYLFGVGIFIFCFGIVIHLVLQDRQRKKLKDKTILTFGATTLTIQIGTFADAELSNDSVFILPANTSFADDCVTDSKSALGSFFKEHHESKIPTFAKELQQILSEQGIKQSNGSDYIPGTVIILPEQYSIKSKVILVASSMRSKTKGFHTNPTIISNSIYNVFKATATKRINVFYFPIIGSGHAGLTHTEALNLLLLCIKFSSKEFTHVKRVFIFVLEQDKNKIDANFVNSYD